MADILHIFCSCVRTVDIWQWLRGRLLELANITQISDMELLNLALSAIRKEQAVVWVVGVYVIYAWRILMADDDIVVREKFLVF